MANALIPVFTGTLADRTVQLCDARTLHTFMQVRRDFTNWIKGRIRKFGFVAGEDYLLAKSGEQVPHQGGTRTVERTDYHLTLDMAKELSMVENNEHGRAARRYFIACERQALEQTVIPHSPAIEPLNGPALVAARQVAEDYFESFRQAVKAGNPNPAMGEIPQDVLQGMVARALFGQRMLSWFDWSTGTMSCKLIPSDSSVFSLSNDNYRDLMEQVPMERIPEMAEAVNRRVACHLGAFTEHLKRSRKPDESSVLTR